MHFSIRHILLVLFVFFLGQSIIIGQVESDGYKSLVKIENAINAGDVEKLAEYIHNKTYFSYTPELTGYFSFSQIYNLLNDYFNAYKPIKFSFISKSANNNSPFGWGEYHYLKNGIRGSYKIFVSLEKSGPNFYISQISIN